MFLLKCFRQQKGEREKKEFLKSTTLMFFSWFDRKNWNDESGNDDDDCWLFFARVEAWRKVEGVKLGLVWVSKLFFKIIFTLSHQIKQKGIPVSKKILYQDTLLLAKGKSESQIVEAPQKDRLRTTALNRRLY